MKRHSYDLENSVKRRRQQDMLFKSPGLSQQEEKALQARLKVIQEKLTLIGSVGLEGAYERKPDRPRSFGPRSVPQVVTDEITKVMSR